MKMKVFLNGRLMSRESARISIDDRGFLVGDGVYETLRVYGGTPFLLSRHLSRLKTSLRRIRLDPGMSMPGIGRAVNQVIRANKGCDGVVRITITRGPGPRGFDPRSCISPTVLITMSLLPEWPQDMARKGVSAAVVPVVRNDPRAAPPEVKTTSCLNNILAKMAANDLRVFEGLMLSGSGYLSEGTISNVFIVRRGILSTPAPTGEVLAGVTRGLVLSLARRAGIPAQERRLSPADLEAADEAFLTSSVMEIVPLNRVVFAERGRRRSVSLRPGPITAALLALYRRATARQTGFPRGKC